MLTHCANCEVKHNVDQDEDGNADISVTWRCQGSDECLTRMCSECVTFCGLCDLPACERHSIRVNGVVTCAICLADESKLKSLASVSPVPASTGLHAA